MFEVPACDLSVAPLTDDERRWIRRLERVLMDAPARLEVVTIGDRSLRVVDRDGALRVDLHDGAAHANGVVLATVRSACNVHGVSG